MTALHTPRVLLASASPRRRQLLEALGVEFGVAATALDEASILNGPGTPAEKAQQLASAKAAAARPGREAFVVGADTVVALGREVLGKPASPDDAAEMLRTLRGRAHQVTTGVAVLRRAGNVIAADAVTTTVWMRHYSPAEIAAYVATGDPLDKAGAYAIQHPQFRPAERIEGCYWNVVGLPLCLLSRLLAQAGVGTAAAERVTAGACTLCVPGGVCPAPDLGQLPSGV